MERPPAGRTDLWLVHKLQQISSTLDSIRARFDRLAVDEVSEAFRKMTDIDASSEPHSFVAVGFERGDQDVLSPVFVSLSNTYDERGRPREPSTEWVLQSEKLGGERVRLDATGAVLDLIAQDELESVLPEIAHDNPAGVVDYLGQAIRAESSGGNASVGESLLGVVLPSRGVGTGAGMQVIGLDELAKSGSTDVSVGRVSG
jgi:hypothetical protein